MAPEPSAVVWVPGGAVAATLGAAARAAGRADLVVLVSGVQPHGDWLERLRAAAHSDTAIASASAMLTGGPWAPEPLPSAGGLERAAAQVAADAGRLRPRIAAPVAGCVLLRRAALDAACGHGDDDASPAAALAAFGERCTALGLSHVLADDVLAAGEPATPTANEAQELDARHPHRAIARELDARPESPVGHAVLVAGRSLDRVSVTIDGRTLGPASTGTQVHALELVAALGRTQRVSLRILTQHDLDPRTRALLEAIDDLTLLTHEQTLDPTARPTDIVHRPSQAFEPADLSLLAPLGQRLVLTHQDLIAYRIPTYHASPAVWERYRRVTQAALSAADHVVFFSEHARGDALADNLVEPESASVVPIGVDHRASAGARPSRPPALASGERPYLLCLGADLAHKNHAFALALAAALRAGHGWDGRVVLAGPAGTAGAASRAQDEDPRAVVRLGPVSEGEKAWLLERAAAVVYPTFYEGFGLIPFEAGAAGTPCVFAAQTALAEVLPGTATIVAWDPAATAAAVVGLLEAGPARDAHVMKLREAAAAYRWDATAQALVRLYEELVTAPPRELRRAARERLMLQQQLADNERARLEEWRLFDAFREQIGSDGLGLVGPEGVLGAEDQRALLALLSRGALRRPALGAARVAYRLAARARRRPARPTR